jgi:phospholipid/cholesterol/gamma-HCH transport system substrate-binding protein
VRVTRRILINLAASAALFAVLAVWALQAIIRPDFLADTYRVEARFMAATGLRPGVEVTYHGIRVGAVDGVELRDGAAAVALDIEADQELPAGAHAAVRRRSPVGEPYVAIEAPPEWSPGDPAMQRDGVVIPTERTSTPVAYGELFTSADEALSAVEPAKLDIVLSELATALTGRGDELRRMLANTASVTATFAEGADDLDQLAAELTALTGTLADKASTIATSTDRLTELVGALAASSDGIETLVERVPSVAAGVDGILEAAYFDLVCGFDALGAVAEPIGTEETIRQVIRLLQAAPSAAATIPKAVYEGPDGRYLSGTFGFVVELPPTQPYSPFPAFEPPPDVPPCPAGTPPRPAGLPASGVASPTVDSDEAGAPSETEPPSGDALDQAPTRGDAEDSDQPPWLARLAGVLGALAVVGAASMLVARRRGRDHGAP